jgi:hypothetical protein
LPKLNTDELSLAKYTKKTYESHMSSFKEIKSTGPSSLESHLKYEANQPRESLVNESEVSDIGNELININNSDFSSEPPEISERRSSLEEDK